MFYNSREIESTNELTSKQRPLQDLPQHKLSERVIRIASIAIRQPLPIELQIRVGLRLFTVERAEHGSTAPRVTKDQLSYTHGLPTTLGATIGWF